MSKLSTYLESLTNAELQEVAALLGADKSRATRKDELVERLLKSGGSQQEIAVPAEKVEALRGFKHIWLFEINPWDSSRSTDNLLQDLWPEAPGSHLDFDAQSDEFWPTLQFADEWSGQVYLKLTHWVESDQWEQTSPGIKELIHRRVRHPLVVVFHSRTGIVEFRFEGYTQGAATDKGRRFPYESLVARAAEFVGARLGSVPSGLRITAAIEDMLTSRASEVSDLRRVVLPEFGGRLVLDAADTGKSRDVAVLLANFFKNAVQAGATDLNDRIRQALADTPAESLLLAWREMGVLTRVALKEIAPELYFIWQGEARQIETIDRVIGIMVTHMRLNHPDMGAALLAVDEAATGALIRAAELAYRFNLSAASAYAVLEDARRREWVQRRYRIRTEKQLQEFPNQWRDSLAGLPASATDEDGRSIDTTDPQNIEVAFERVRRGSDVN